MHILLENHGTVIEYALGNCIQFNIGVLWLQICFPVKYNSLAQPTNLQLLNSNIGILLFLANGKLRNYGECTVQAHNNNKKNSSMFYDYYKYYKMCTLRATKFYCTIIYFLLINFVH